MNFLFGIMYDRMATENTLGNTPKQKCLLTEVQLRIVWRISQKTQFLLEKVSSAHCILSLSLAHSVSGASQSSTEGQTEHSKAQLFVHLSAPTDVIMCPAFRWSQKHSPAAVEKTHDPSVAGARNS